MAQTQVPCTLLHPDEVRAMREELRRLVASAFLEGATRSAFLLTELVAFVRQKFPDLSALLALEEVMNAAADVDFGFNLVWTTPMPDEKSHQLMSGIVAAQPK